MKSRKAMRQNIAITNRKEKVTGSPGTKPPDGYPLYPAGDDIFNKFHEEADLDPEEISRKKDSVVFENPGINSQSRETDIESGGNLDVPGSELDDNQEDIGSEDEENNYYSIGGDAHNNLDENQGE